MAEGDAKAILQGIRDLNRRFDEHDKVFAEYVDKVKPVIEFYDNLKRGGSVVRIIGYSIMGAVTFAAALGAAIHYAQSVFTIKP